MLDNGIRIEEKDLEDNISKMDRFTKVNGLMINQMEKV